MSMKKKITIISITLTVIIILVGTILLGRHIVMAKNDNKKITSDIAETKPEKIPEVTPENITFDISEIEQTNDNVIIKVNSKLEGYNLYYCIKPVVILEEESSDAIDNVEENQEEIPSETEEYILYEDSIEVFENSKIYFKYELEGTFSKENYELEINNIIKEVPENESATTEQLEKEKVDKKEINNSKAPYYIVVNYSSNVVTIYRKDENNEYTIPVKAMICSTGVATPRSGVYKLTARYRWQPLFGNVYGQYAVKIVGNILFHSVPYLKPDNSTLEYWEYDKLGTSASAGCVRLTVADALWIYSNCGSGTQVEFTANSANPLGKPSARKISGYEAVRGFDPTDPAANNPWKTFISSDSINPGNDIPQDNNIPPTTPDNNKVPVTPEPVVPTPSPTPTPDVPEEKPVIPDTGDNDNSENGDNNNNENQKPDINEGTEDKDKTDNENMENN